MLLIGLTAVVVALAWRLFAAGDRPSAAQQVESASAKEAASPAHATELTSPSDDTRKAIAHATNESAASATPSVRNLDTFELSGSFVFADGSVPPEMTIEVNGDDTVSHRAGAPENVALGDLGCRDAERTRTDAVGRFRMSGLCAGAYGMRFYSFPTLGTIGQAFQVPSDDVRIQIDGYLVRVITRDERGAILSDSRVSAHFKPAVPDEDFRVPPIDATTNESGERIVCFPAPGTVALNARNKLARSLPSTILLSGPSFSRTHTLVLDQHEIGACLRVNVHSCDERSAKQEHYCITLQESDNAESSLRLCSEQESPDGSIRDLPPGKYEAAIAKRFVGTLDFALTSQRRLVPVELVGGAETKLDLCVTLGGRIALVVRDDEQRPSSAEGLVADATVVGDGDKRQRHLRFRDPDEDGKGVTIGSALPFDVERVTQDVLSPGAYEVLVAAPGYTSATVRVNVYAGEVAKATVRLMRAKSE